MKAKEDVISEFNDYVNMTAEELESWLKSGDSNSAGWPKEDDNNNAGAEGGGETVGHDSGRNIVEILKANPEKKEDQYTDEQVEHMRKVVSYCKRHLAQESKTNSEKSTEEVKKTKSYASLKNWGHDFLKAQGEKEKGEGKSSQRKDGGEEEKEKGTAESNGSKGSKKGSKKEGEEEEEEKEKEEPEKEPEQEKNADDDDESKEKAGDKRKTAGEENGSNKKRQTRQGEGKSTETANKKADNGDDIEKEGDEGEETEDGDADEQGDEMENGSDNDNKKKTKKGPKKGDTVSWKWGNGQPEGKVLDVKEEKTTIETKRGNEVSRDGNPDDPAVVLDTGRSKAIKSKHELN